MLLLISPQCVRVCIKEGVFGLLVSTGFAPFRAPLQCIFLGKHCGGRRFKISPRFLPPLGWGPTTVKVEVILGPEYCCWREE